MAARSETTLGVPDRTTLAAFFALVVIGGSNVVAVRLSNDSLPPFFGAAVRFAAAGVVLLVVMGVRRIPFPRGAALVGTILYGVLGFAVFYALGYWALRPEGLPASVASVVLASMPLLTFFFALAHRLEAFRWRALAGALIAIGGIVVLIGGELTLSVPGTALLAAFGAAAAGAESGVVIKLLPPSHPVATNGVAMAIGAALLLAISAIAGERWALPSRTGGWATLAYLIVLGSVGLFGLFLFVLKRWTASGTSYFTVLMPIVATVLGAWLLDQPVTPAVVLGGLVIIAGVYVGALSHGRVPAEAPAEHEALAQSCSSC